MATILEIDPWQIFYILWFFVFPILGVVLAIVLPVFWFFIVPKVARMLTWKRFKKVSFHLIADDTGYTDLVPTKEELPEGVVRTKKGWRFLPRRRWEQGKTKTKEKNVQDLLLRKFVWRDMGKPIWFGYAGKVGSFNPATLAAIQQSKGNPKSGSQPFLAFIQKIWGDKEIPEEIRSEVKELIDQINFQPLTIVDPTTIKEILPKMFTPSQIDALATNREMRGLKRAGKQYTRLFVGFGLIVGLIVLAIVLMAFLK